MSRSSLLAEVFEVLPVASFVVDPDGVVLLANGLGRRMIQETPEGIASEPRRAGSLLHCVNAENEMGGCGRGEACPDCGLRGVVGEALQTGLPARRQVSLVVRAAGGVAHLTGLASAAPLEHGDDRLAVVALQEGAAGPH